MLWLSGLAFSGWECIHSRFLVFLHCHFKGKMLQNREHTSWLPVFRMYEQLLAWNPPSLQSQSPLCCPPQETWLALALPATLFSAAVIPLYLLSPSGLPGSSFFFSCSSQRLCYANCPLNTEPLQGQSLALSFSSFILLPEHLTLLGIVYGPLSFSMWRRVERHCSPTNFPLMCAHSWHPKSRTLFSISSHI